MTIQILDKLHESGELRNLITSGLVSENVLLWRKIWHCYHNEIDKGVQRMQAIQNVSDVFAVENRTVYRVLKRLKK